MVNHFMELAFGDSVRKVQTEQGTRDAYQRMEEKNAFRNQLTWQEKAYIGSRDSFYLASVSESGWPYMQYRGGPKGFLHVVDDNTLAFADFRGNGQYISTGNFKASKKAMLFLMDYTKQQRLKIWAEVEVVNAKDRPDFVEQFAMPDYPATVERIYLFKVQAFDWNCPQHITPRYTLKEIEEGKERFLAGKV